MKKLFLMLALFSAVLSANAQIATENSNALDNIGVGITAGVSTPLDFNSVFPLNLNGGIKVTKDFTPTFGIQFEGLAVFNDNHFADMKTMVKATNIGLNGAINLSNAFWGYMGTPRTWEVSAVAGIGWLRAWDIKDNSLTAKTGADIAFNFGRAKQHSLVLTPAVYWNLHKIDAIQFNKNGAQLALNLSYIYHFRTSNGTHHFKTYDIGAMISEIDRLNGALAECESREPKVIEKIVVKEVVVNKEAANQSSATNTITTPTGATVRANDGSQWIVPFAFDSSKISQEAKFILERIGENTVVDITATASPSGSKAHNQWLSEARAKAVADFLSRRGVKVNSAVGKGVDAVSGKTAIVTVAQ